jgi:hypothetical protein
MIAPKSASPSVVTVLVNAAALAMPISRFTRFARKGVTVGVIAGVMAGVCGGCSAKVTTVDKQLPETAVSYAVDFQNAKNAISSALLQVQVFDASKVTDRVSFCQDLTARKKKGQPFPEGEYTVLQDTGLISTCDVQAAAGTPPAGKISVPGFGARAILVVAQRPDNVPILVGCGIGDVAQTGSEPITVTLDLFDSRFNPVWSTGNCARLSDRCAGRCTAGTGP